MSLLGQMVRAGESAAMKVIDIDAGLAHCIWVDGNGRIRHRYCELSALTPFWMTLGPKSLWPQTNQADLVAIEKEEQEAKAARRKARKAARKAKRSNKTHRKAAA